ncbi:HNH endonuclease [Fictibacillus nanhaiensis]|uniref:HNH endonuclease n=1 Tax=Fictibacillus nanhaiensis TaxID=742169 RepID=UPI003CC7FD37
MTKTCARCHVTKPLSEFSKNRKHKDSLRNDCKVCQSEAKRKYLRTYTGKAKNAQTFAKYRRKRAEKAIGQPIKCDLTSHQVSFILSEGSCGYCQKPLEYAEATVDHVIPHARGGYNTFDNVVCACSSCNATKRDRPALLFMLQSCSPHASKRLLERLALRSGSDVTEIYAGLVVDAHAYFEQVTSDA